MMQIIRMQRTKCLQAIPFFKLKYNLFTLIIFPVKLVYSYLYLLLTH